jgi:hypothetical protein
MLKRTLLFAALHVLVIVGLLLLVVASGGDDSAAEPQGIERAATALIETLGQPGLWAHKAFNTSGNDAVEWSLVGATSLLWGAMFASFTGRR